MKFGFTLKSSRMKWMPYNEDLDQSFMTDKFVSKEMWRFVHIVVICSISITVLYILVQVWFKTRMRYLRKPALSSSCEIAIRVGKVHWLLVLVFVG